MKRVVLGLALLICAMPLLAEQADPDVKRARMAALLNDPAFQSKIAVKLAAAGRQDLLSPEKEEVPGPVKAVPSKDKTTGQIIGVVEEVGDYFFVEDIRTVLAIVRTRISGFTDFNVIICLGQTISGQCKALRVNRRVKVDGEIIVQYDEDDEPTLDYLFFTTKRTT